MLSLKDFKKISVNTDSICGGSVGSTYTTDTSTEIDNPNCSDGCDNDIRREVFRDMSGDRISECNYHEC